MGVGGRRRARSLMGCVVRGKGTTVGDGVGGLARSKGGRFRLCHLGMVSTSGRHQAGPPMESAVSRRGTTVGDAGDWLAHAIEGRSRCVAWGCYWGGAWRVAADVSCGG